MSIVYNYEIVSVDEQARCMEIIYSAEGYETFRISARLPFDGETLEEVVVAYEPVRRWEEMTLPVVAPQVGASGIIDPSLFLVKS